MSDKKDTEEKLDLHNNIQKIFGIVTAAVIILFVFWFITDVFVAPGNTDSIERKPYVVPTELKEPELVTTVSQIALDYESNELAANKNYKNKIISVTGNVDEISSDLLGSPYILLKDQSFNYVQCVFNSENSLLKLSKGNYVTLKGKVTGYSLGIVVIEDCSIMR